MNQPEWIETAAAGAAPADPESPGIDHVEPYLPLKLKPASSSTAGRRLVAIGAGAAVVILWMAFSVLSRISTKGAHDRAPKHNAPAPQTASNPALRSSLTPIMGAERSSFEESPANSVDGEQLVRRSTAPRDRSLGSNPGKLPMPWLEDRRPRQGPPEAASNAASPTGLAIPERDIGQAPRETANTVSPSSLVFVAKANSVGVPGPAVSHVGPEVDLPAGTRLRARLEAAVNSAVHAPVVAIVEYNYEQNGAIVIPAGARVTGELEAAGRSGYVQIRFDSLSISGMAPFRLQGIATDLELRPLRGRVEGKNTGKNLLVRSASGIGQIAATLAGRGSLDQPLSERDLLRERLSNNIGQAADQRLAGLALSEQAVVVIAAGTEIYVVLEKSAIEATHPEKAPSPPLNQRNLDELRQLLQLERELEQSQPASQ